MMTNTILLIYTTIYQIYQDYIQIYLLIIIVIRIRLYIVIISLKFPLKIVQIGNKRFFNKTNTTTNNITILFDVAYFQLQFKSLFKQTSWQTYLASVSPSSSFSLLLRQTLALEMGVSCLCILKYRYIIHTNASIESSGVTLI